MATPSEKLAASLEHLKSITDTGELAIKSKQLSRVHRERLLKNGFIKEVVKGWYIPVPPDEQPGGTTSWFASYWKFCAKYLDDRFGNKYCLSPEQSLLIHAGNWSVPAQLMVRVTNGTNAITPFLHGTSLFNMKSNLPDEVDIVVEQGIRMPGLPYALARCSPTMFKISAMDMRTALARIQNSSEVLRVLLDGGRSTIAGRLAGAFKNMGKDRIASEIVDTMKKAGYDIREVDPFDAKSEVQLLQGARSPYVNRIRLLWNEMRSDIPKLFPKAPGIPANHKEYMKHVEEIYVTDAYHSLSIEHYRVTPDLIEHVRRGKWDPKGNEKDLEQKDAMAARGYWQAAQKVKESLKKVLKNVNPGKVWDGDHGDWYGELFAPSVAAGIVKPSDLAGYRNDQVYIGRSMHVPMNREAVREVMPELTELLKNEREPSVRVVLGHFIFVYVHPYMDGNGRMGRFLMNLMLASGGYPWTVIPFELRESYMKSLEKASVEQDIKPFTKFLAHLVNESIKGKPVAKLNVQKN